MTQQNKSTQRQDVHKTNTVILRFYAMVVIIAAALLGWNVYSNAVAGEQASHPFKLGLDLAGGSHLVYEADVSAIDPADVTALMQTLREVIERRVNIFGVSEPIVQVEQSSIVTGDQKQRLVVELPGVTDVADAVAEIGRTPLLEFKLVDQQALATEQALADLETSGTGTAEISNIRTNGEALQPYIDTGLTGRYLEGAQLEFAGQTQSGGLANEPIVAVRFNSEGADLFEDITRNNVGENLAIFLDGELISAPRINEPIAGGSAIISGGFTPDEAKSLAENLSFGALPVPIELQSTQSIGASLGGEVLGKGIEAGMVGFGLIVLFMLVWYRLPGVVAIVALSSYVAIMLALFQFIPVTLTAAGLAGFILSIGMAVDANVLVFERLKEEYRAGASSTEAARTGFTRAWSAIRDGNVTSLLSAIILFWFGTSIVKGFALVFGIGVIVSMLTALVVTRTLLLSLPETKREAGGLLSKLFNSGM